MVILKPEYFTTEEDIPATVFHLGLVGQYGPIYYSWEPETLWLEIQDDYGVDPEEDKKNLIQAVCAINHIDSVYKECDIFRHIILALNYTDPSFEVGGPLEAAQMAWGLDEIQRNCNYTKKYDEEIWRYVHASLENEDFLSVPERISKHIKFEYQPDVDPKIAAMADVKREEMIRQKKVDAFVLLQQQKLSKYLHTN